MAQDSKINDSIKSLHAHKKEIKKPLSMTISFFNHSISMPFHKIFAQPIHPGIQVGVEGRYFENNRSKLFQTLNAGMFYNNYNGKGFYLNSEFAYRYTSKSGIFAETLLGIGYLRTYHPTDIYELNNSGTYQKVNDKGFSSPIVSFAFGLGYAFKSSSLFSFAPFIRYESIIQTHYNSDLEVLPQSAFHIGLRITKKRIK
ncbi:MAG TPA: hypothetical protein VGQ59_18150 [Cyclobacteriaceae bacterium]|nr:hypothetical protein [Cyclobacteriaceae bacterium]